MSFKQPNHYRQLEASCGSMGVKRWRAIKGFIYIIIMAAVALAGIFESRSFVPITFIVASMLIFGIEIKEIQIADKLSVTFSGGLEARGLGELDDSKDDDQSQK